MEENYNSSIRRKNRMLSILIGIIFIAAAISLFIFLLIRPPEYNMTLFILLGIFLLLLGYKSISRNFTKVSNETQLSEYLTISKESDVEDYINYKSNNGFSGFFKSIGITGLPLVTILITLIFCLLAIFSYGINAVSDKEIIPQDFPKLVLELSKLTLGAFIGSFVNQKKGVVSDVKNKLID